MTLVNRLFVDVTVQTGLRSTGFRGRAHHSHAKHSRTENTEGGEKTRCEWWVLRTHELTQGRKRVRPAYFVEDTRKYFGEYGGKGTHVLKFNVT